MRELLRSMPYLRLFLGFLKQTRKRLHLERVSPQDLQNGDVIMWVSVTEVDETGADDAMEVVYAGVCTRGEQLPADAPLNILRGYRAPAPLEVHPVWEMELDETPNSIIWKRMSLLGSMPLMAELESNGLLMIYRAPYVREADVVLLQPQKWANAVLARRQNSRQLFANAYDPATAARGNRLADLPADLMRDIQLSMLGGRRRRTKRKF